MSVNIKANGGAPVPFGPPPMPIPLSHPASSMYPRPLNPTSATTPNKPNRVPNAKFADSDSLNLAMQVGEDAYFIRPDAMGVSDGVGGWSRSPFAKEANSAMFSKSLMHYCSYEIGLVSDGQDGGSSDDSLSFSQGKGKVKATHPENNTSFGSFFWNAHDSLHSAPVQSSSAQPSASSSTASSSSSPPDINPVDILQRAYDRCMAWFKSQGLTGGSATALLAILRDQELRVAHLGDCALVVMRNGDLLYRSEEMQHAVSVRTCF